MCILITDTKGGICMFCPIMSTPTHKHIPSHATCRDCYFYLVEQQTSSTYCAIRLAAERASDLTKLLLKK